MSKNKLPLPAYHPTILFLSFFGSGLTRWAPGTFGTIATALLLYLFPTPSTFQGEIIIAVLFFLLLISSIMIVDYTQKKFKIHDPGWIVIDEVLGLLLAWMLIGYHRSLLQLVILTVFFRFFDIVKVYPANWCDQKIRHGAGTILDDLVSGIYAALLFLILKKIAIIS